MKSTVISITNNQGDPISYLTVLEPYYRRGNGGFDDRYKWTIFILDATLRDVKNIHTSSQIVGDGDKVVSEIDTQGLPYIFRIIDHTLDMDTIDFIQ